MKELYDKEMIESYIIEDKYHRIEEITYIDKILSKYQGIRLGINGEWGSGKSVVAKMMYYASNYKFSGEITNNLEEKFKFLCKAKTIYFDASKEDIFEEPLLSLAKVIAKALDGESVFEKQKIVGTIIKMLKLIPLIGEIASVVDEAKEGFEKESEFKNLYSTQAIIDQVHGLFEKNKKYLLIIDELDRCNPKYVLNLFNIIKHFFDIDNLSIVYFYNYEELWNLVKKEYGYQNEQYIQKFVDYEIKLNDSYNHYYSCSYDAIDIKIKHCQLLFGLTLRDTNNLYFLVKELSSICHTKYGYSFVIYICCVLIKKIPLYEVNIEMIKSKIDNLKSVYLENDANLIIRNIESNFNDSNNLKEIER